MNKKKYIAPQTEIIQLNTGEILEGPLDLGSIQGDPKGLGGEGSTHPVDAKENNFQYEPYEVWKD
ncbi:hypothetical protein [Prevotella sp. HUN102]|uniref:hypothetical protein n=1 Tax=Prevotella sp. HUN102 TaxID=1392486 RepID=UPI00048C76FB|nr:hypothetical protein [Prevotella sp. HUN102]